MTPPPDSFLLIENVGNLVCPALFDLGERAKVVVMSVTEGVDKPLKYPHAFRAATAMVLTKVDLAPYVDVDPAQLIENARQINPALHVFPVAATQRPRPARVVRLAPSAEARVDDATRPNAASRRVRPRSNACSPRFASSRRFPRGSASSSCCGGSSRSTPAASSRALAHGRGAGADPVQLDELVSADELLVEPARRSTACIRCRPRSGSRRALAACRTELGVARTTSSS